MFIVISEPDMIEQVLVEKFSNFTNRMVCNFLSAYGWRGNPSKMQRPHITSNRDVTGPLTGFRSVQLKTELPSEFEFSKGMDCYKRIAFTFKKCFKKAKAQEKW